ncbi:putative beta-galactosidase [Aspergillus flavus]|uniref:Beta-galactosidase n=1 Tax=Aspergillus flavus (strain ATCC 200026 / FGSC A1120 / IAM 13836 / NRRL 3357 / JCM 12722 / SRRC 167) TaxID=332952 RepID=A0A7U2MYC8_ASPFN|nr:putative beta-galactosidase [Aspergillus flavus]
MLAGEYAPSRDPVPSVWLDAVEKVGLLGWLQRVKDILRTTAPNLLSAIDNYMSHVYKIIADAQITNGGLVILLQAENEYSMFEGEALGLDRQYMQYFIDKARDAGIVVPITSNDANNNGYNAPGTGLGVIDIYGYDQYPIGLSLYSIGGGTNWVNLGYPDFYASYDLGAIIAEEGTVTREKYSEAKSQGQFFKVALATTLHGLSNQIQPRCYHPAYEYVHSPYTSAKHPMELKQAPTKVTFQALFHDIHVYR